MHPTALIAAEAGSGEAVLFQRARLHDLFSTSISARISRAFSQFLSNRLEI